MAFFASSKSKGAALLVRPVTVPISSQPRLTVSSGESSPVKGPSPTRVTNALNITITSSTLFGPSPTSEHIADAVMSLEVTKG